eukprot:8042395-Alexandrium_andersonii.AAC.1
MTATGYSHAYVTPRKVALARRRSQGHRASPGMGATRRPRGRPGLGGCSRRACRSSPSWTPWRDRRGPSGR